MIRPAIAEMRADQKRDARHETQQILDPDFSADALEHQAEGPGADQDIRHHGGDPHGRRHALVEQRPGQRALKRGGGAKKVTLDEAALVTETRAAELLALDEALENLAAFDPRMSKIVEMRYFGGLSNEEIAEVLKIHPNTVMRDWSAAKAWLYAALSGEEC